MHFETLGKKAYLFVLLFCLRKNIFFNLSHANNHTHIHAEIWAFSMKINLLDKNKGLGKWCFDTKQKGKKLTEF